ncbi:MAG: DUF302 domain-containing protein [Bauldia sp.]
MEDGLVTLVSRRSVHDTIDALCEAVAKVGLEVFLRIDHAANAAKVGMTLRPTELLMFGNPVNGTILMEDEQAAGLDLPMRAAGVGGRERRGLADLQRSALDRAPARARLQEPDRAQDDRNRHGDDRASGDRQLADLHRTRARRYDGPRKADGGKAADTDAAVVEVVLDEAGHTIYSLGLGCP